MKKIIIFITLITSLLSLFAQEDMYAPVLSQIEQNSTTLKALREQADAQKLSYRTGLAPSDPEVEFGYLWGNPMATGNRKDISVKQTFDFPTTYIRRRQMADQQGESADFSYRQQRLELLLSAKQACINLVYYNALLELYRKQAERAAQIESACEKMLKKGSGNQLDYNKAVFNRISAEGEVAKIRLECERLMTELQQLNGGQPIAFDFSAYGTPSLPADFETWYATVKESHPALQYLHSQEAVADCNIRLNRSAWLPKWSVGYMGEFIPEQRFQGVTVGLTLPLWENENRVRQAQAEAVATAQQRNDVELRYRSQWQRLYAQATQLRETVERYAAVFSQHNNADLLYKAYISGEMPLLNYLLETDYYLSAYVKQLQAQRDLELTLSELNGFRL